MHKKNLYLVGSIALLIIALTIPIAPHIATTNVIGEGVTKVKQKTIYANQIICVDEDPLVANPTLATIITRITNTTITYIELFKGFSTTPSYRYVYSTKDSQDTVRYVVVFRFDNGYSGTLAIGHDYCVGSNCGLSQRAHGIPTRTYEPLQNYRYVLTIPRIAYSRYNESGQLDYNVYGQLWYWHPTEPLKPIISANNWRYSLQWWFGSPTNTTVSLTNPSITGNTAWNNNQYNITLFITITSSNDVGKQIKYIRLLVQDATQGNAFMYYGLKIELGTPFTIEAVGDTIAIKVQYILSSSV